jgi:hypothetical protein
VGVGSRAQACAFARVALIILHATRRHIIICGLSGSTIFFPPHYLINGAIFWEKKKLMALKCLFLLSLQHLAERNFIS